MRIAFLGTPEFALPALEALLGAGHEIVRVVSRPPRPAGRGHRPRPSPVQVLAQSRGLPVATPDTLRDPALQAEFAALDLDAAVVVAYGALLPGPVLAAPRLGCLNIHPSLLPRWRGPAPIQRAILAGDGETGVSVMLMDEGLDTGPVLLSRSVPLGPDATGRGMHERLAALGAEMICAALAGLSEGELVPVPQSECGVTYAAKPTRGEGRLDWTRSGAELDRLVRGLAPRPGAWFVHGAERIGVRAAEPAEGIGEPGTVLDARLTVACGDGALRLTEVQRQGRAPLAADAFLRGFPLPPGTRLDPCPATAC